MNQNHGERSFNIPWLVPTMLIPSRVDCRDSITTSMSSPTTSETRLMCSVIMLWLQIQIILDHTTYDVDPRQKLISHIFSSFKSSKNYKKMSVIILSTSIAQWYYFYPTKMRMFMSFWWHKHFIDDLVVSVTLRTFWHQPQPYGHRRETRRWTGS